jgi:hypothetical protein
MLHVVGLVAGTVRNMGVFFDFERHSGGGFHGFGFSAISLGFKSV